MLTQRIRLCPCRGAAYANQKQYALAARDFKHALQLDPVSRNAAQYLEAVTARAAQEGVSLELPEDKAPQAEEAAGAEGRLASKEQTPGVCQEKKSKAGQGTEDRGKGGRGREAEEKEEGRHRDRDRGPGHRGRSPEPERRHQAAAPGGSEQAVRQRQGSKERSQSRSRSRGSGSSKWEWAKSAACGMHEASYACPNEWQQQDGSMKSMVWPLQLTVLSTPACPRLAGSDSSSGSSSPTSSGSSLGPADHQAFKKALAAVLKERKGKSSSKKGKKRKKKGKEKKDRRSKKKRRK